MFKFATVLSLSTLLLASAASSSAERSEPVVTIDVKNYDALLSNVGALMGAMGQDAAMVQMQMQGMLGAELYNLIDSSEPWHAAVFLESVAAAPVISVSLPIADFEAFQVAVATSMLGQLGAQYLDVGDRVVLYGSKPGAIVPAGWGTRIETYANSLELASEDTIEVGLKLDDELRQAAISGLTRAKAQVLSTFDQPGVDAAGMPPETMKRIMEGYFSFYETLLTDTDRLDFGLNISDGDLAFSVEITPVAGSGFADFIASQNIDITDLAASVDWGSDMAMVVGMGDLPDAWQPLIDSAMQSLMPLYGLEDQAASEWTEVMQASLPFKGVYNINFKQGDLAFSGFYDILDASGREVYDQWLTITQEAGLGEGAASYYSEINIKKAFRQFNGQSVDRIEMILNPEHPMMQLPEQKAAMDRIFKDGKMVYEMALVDNRIYMATEGALEAAFESKGAGNAPAEINANTRFLGTIDFATIFRMGADFSGEPMPPIFEGMEAGDLMISYAIETSQSLTFKTVAPLSIFTSFAGLQK